MVKAVTRSGEAAVLSTSNRLVKARSIQPGKLPPEEPLEHGNPGKVFSVEEVRLAQNRMIQTQLWNW